MSAFSISSRASSIRPSATLAVAARAGELRAAGQNVLDFSAGEPDFKPPTAVRQAVAAMAANEVCRYTPVPGTPALRDAVAAELSAVHGKAWTRGEILISCGAKHSLANLFFAALDPGDEVVVLSPFWVSYPEMVELAGGRPVIAVGHAADRWRVRPEALEAALSPKTKLVVLNSPSNPTGAGYRAEDLRVFGEVMSRKAPQAWLVTDDIYRRLTYDGFQFASAVSTLSDLTDRVIVVDGVSKTYAMTGYRIGYMAGPADLIKAAANIQGQTTSNPTTTSQLAARIALTDPSVPGEVAQMAEAFTRRRSLVLDALASIPSLSVVRPDGAFYVFVDFSRHMGPGTPWADDVAFATWLLEERLVATVPGTPFGAAGHLRMSYATDDSTLRDGLSRIAEAIDALPTSR